MFGQKTAHLVIQGTVSAGFEAVKTEFRRNFTERGELGAACAIYYQGQKVVDLWGGLRDEREGLPWQQDTLVLVFSVTKGLSAMCLALAHSRGWLDYDEKVATYWPEFAQQGKADITVRQLLAHQAGLCAIDEPLDLATIADLDKLAAVIARQRPAWPPGQKHGYHAISLGWYMGQLLRCVDPQRRSLGRFFQEEIARPLDLEFYIGLPTSVPASRVATIKGFWPIWLLFQVNKMPGPLVRAYLHPRSLTARTFKNPQLATQDYNRPEIRALEMPASNGIGQVRSIAKAYSVFATAGHELQLEPATLRALSATAVPPASGTLDEVLKVHTAYDLGYLRPSAHTSFGSSPRAFGASGAGGAFAFADPAAQVGYAYAMNRMGLFLRNDPRQKALQQALYQSLERIR